MNWLVLILAFAIAVLVGGYLARLLERSRPAWSARRRLWTAAIVLPAFLILATIVGLVWLLAVGPGTGENMQDLALTVTAFVGGLFALLTMIGGLVGATFAQRGEGG